MSKYQSITTAIQLVEAAAKIMNGGLIPEGEAGEIIQDLRDMAKDARFGGVWDGDYETVVMALRYCSDLGFSCSTCPYHKETACKQRLKKDAALAIRHLSSRLQKYESEGGEVR